MPEASAVTTSTQKTIEQIIAEQANKSKNTRNTGELGKNDFLKLLITQVQHQDPLDPQTDTDFIAQMAQFSALEQMQNLNNAFSMTKGFGMIGKFAIAQTSDDDTGRASFISGVVESVRVRGGIVYAIIDGREIEIDKIIEVSDTTLGNGGKRISDYSGMVGMLGSAYVFNQDGDRATIKGIISSLEQRADGIYARLDEVDIRPYELDMTGFEGPEEYVLAYAGKEITVRYKDPETGTVVKVTGTLRDGYIDDSERLHLILDNVALPVESVYSTELADLYSSEHMLLQQILIVLRERLGAGQQNEKPDEETGETGTVTEPGNETGEPGAVTDPDQETDEPGEAAEPDPSEAETPTGPEGGVG